MSVLLSDACSVCGAGNRFLGSREETAWVREKDRPLRRVLSLMKEPLRRGLSDAQEQNTDRSDRRRVTDTLYGLGHPLCAETDLSREAETN